MPAGGLLLLPRVGRGGDERAAAGGRHRRREDRHPVGASASSNVTHGNAQALTSFGETLSFPDVGPVFNLPDGYTVNSVSGLIVDNRWVGVLQATVPEPSTLVLLLVGGAGVLRWPRRAKL